MLVDDIKIKVFAGKGGDGIVTFSKIPMSLGPTGGQGGRGGDVYLEGVANIGALAQFRNKKVFRAENGQIGGSKKRSGKDGEDLTLKVPVGTVAHNLSFGKDQEIIQIGQKLQVIKGGRGGRGNFFFRSSTNTTPRQFEKGRAGGTAELRLELKLIADVGFVGLPNVGKSSLLNELTNANIKVANYPFTTLEPNLGAFFDLILADIPGLIEGASDGKGLGIKFLRHIERTGIFFHFVSAETDDPARDYRTVRQELEKYNPELLKKKEYVFLSKCDLAEPEAVAKKIKALKKLNPDVLAISILDPESLKEVKKILSRMIEAKTAREESM